MSVDGYDVNEYEMFLIRREWPLALLAELHLR